MKIALLAFLISSISLCAQAQTLNLAAINSTPMFGEKMMEQGKFTAVTKAIFKRAGYDIDVSFVPMRKAISEARKGKFDGVVGDYLSKDRRQNFYFSNAIYRTEKIFIQNKGRGISFSRMDELKRFKIGSLAGTLYTEDLRGFGIETKEFETDIASLRALNEEQIDLALIGKAQYEFKLNQKELIGMKGDLEPLGRSFKFYDLFCSISKKREDGKLIIDRFNQAMKEMKQDGSFQQLLFNKGLRKRPN